MDRIEVQVQRKGGHWQTYAVTHYEPTLIKTAIDVLKIRFPHKKVRAIDKHGRLVDFAW